MSGEVGLKSKYPTREGFIYASKEGDVFGIFGQGMGYSCKIVIKFVFNCLGSVNLTSFTTRVVTLVSRLPPHPITVCRLLYVSSDYLCVCTIPKHSTFCLPEF